MGGFQVYEVKHDLKSLGYLIIGFDGQMLHNFRSGKKEDSINNE